ncbi:protein-disulfide reductase DsbD family protein [Arsukibacterium sp.]|uniref:protein-disulfide reductase DsbD family protein n=1 Tax=Arsukibacterium sp. TaxID=1977258 RepID=UPI002FDB7F82
MTVLTRCRHWLSALCIAALFFASVLQAGNSGWQQSTHLVAELASEYHTVQPGQKVSIALHFVHDEGWHTYWQNPGDSGLATKIHWQLPAGVSSTDIQWPTPKAYPIPPLKNYGYGGPAVLLTELILADDLPLGELVLSAKADWLICEDVCIPADARFSLTLQVAERAELAVDYQALFADARAAMPQLLAISGDYDIAANSFSAVINDLPPVNFSHFFVAATELVEHAQPQQLLFSDNQWLLRQPLNTYFSAAPEAFELVMVSETGQGYSLPLLLRAVEGEVSGGTPVLVTRGDLAGTGLWLVLLMAATGGLILNLMPCVFPVLSLKALSIAANTGQRAQQRQDALWYTLGVVLSFVALALVLLALRAAGSAIGWGFQLQSPLLVALLAYLLFALGLSLSGVVQFGLGLMSTGAGLTQSKGAKGSFFTGVLAVIVASPCTAPFMGGALGYAVTQPAYLALLVFVALGLGMALPFLLLAYIPVLARALPKPGAWMDTLKHLLAYPLYLSAVWLAWVFGRQTGIDALALLLCGMVAIAAACWLWGRWQFSRQGRLMPVMALGLILVAVAAVSVAPANEQQQTAAGAHWQSWSAAKLAELRASNTPVLVNMTADWCITCLVNERVALNTDSSKAALEQYGVSYLKGDWTRRDDAITAYLHQYQRDGVPLYVLYWPGQPPKLLPQILTPDTLRQTFDSLSQPSQVVN